MESKIILALSILRESAKTGKPLRFSCPDKSVQTGVQTNEAPVKYLLKNDPSIRRILCLVTDSARSSGALDQLRRTVAGVSRLVQIEEIPIDNTGKMSRQTMAMLAQQLDPGDRIYLDSSGGSRYTVMGLLQLTRILEFKGIRLQQVVYANISQGQTHTIDDVTDLYRRLDLIAGMHELAEFGSVDSLRKYFRQTTSPDAGGMLELLSAIEQMTDAITLCRLNVLKAALTQYQTAMDRAGAIHDPIIRELVGILRDKFGSITTTPGLIEWCLDHKMLTQALSLYREWMPEYLLRSSGLFTAVPELPDHRSWMANRYQDRHVFLWSHLMNLALPEETRGLDMYYTIGTIRNLDRLLPGSGFEAADLERLRRAAWDFQYIQCLRNMVLHGNADAAIDNRLRRELDQLGYDTKFETMSAADMLRSLRRALNNTKPR